MRPAIQFVVFKTSAIRRPHFFLPASFMRPAVQLMVSKCRPHPSASFFFLSEARRLLFCRPHPSASFFSCRPHFVLSASFSKCRPHFLVGLIFFVVGLMISMSASFSCRPHFFCCRPHDLSVGLIFDRQTDRLHVHACKTRTHTHDTHKHDACTRARHNSRIFDRQTDRLHVHARRARTRMTRTRMMHARVHAITRACTDKHANTHRHGIAYCIRTRACVCASMHVTDVRSSAISADARVWFCRGSW